MARSAFGSVVDGRCFRSSDDCRSAMDLVSFFKFYAVGVGHLLVVVLTPGENGSGQLQNRSGQLQNQDKMGDHEEGHNYRPAFLLVGVVMFLVWFETKKPANQNHGLLKPNQTKVMV